MRNLTSLFGLDVRYSYHRMGRKILVARWDWDEVYGGIVQCPSCGQRDRPPWKNGTGIGRVNNIKDRPVGGAPTGDRPSVPALQMPGVPRVFRVDASWNQTQ